MVVKSHNEQKNKGKQQRRKVLEGHKRIGKRFIPPIKQIPMKSVSYVDDMLPELVWIGLINEKVGYIEGTRILETIFIAVNEIKKDDQQSNFSLISSFRCLSTKQKIRLVELFKKSEILDVIRDAIAPLVLLYDDCPLIFIGPPSNVFSREELVFRIKECVGKTVNKYETPGIVLHGAMLLFRLVTGTTHFPSDMDSPDFDAVINKPGSEEAEHAAGLLRINGLGEFGVLNLDNTWARCFWNCGVEISQCRFGEQNE
ncbi:MAG: hypothetical protein OXF42_04030 [Candidatus Dadabacteria bacterium]|nr:hypothetical protein [Candidatus Dadabacteria bacterium]